MMLELSLAGDAEGKLGQGYSGQAGLVVFFSYALLYYFLLYFTF